MKEILLLQSSLFERSQPPMRMTRLVLRDPRIRPGHTNTSHRIAGDRVKFIPFLQGKFTIVQFEERLKVPTVLVAEWL